MKRFLAVILLVILIVQTNASLFTIISYEVNKDYISENLCENKFESFQGKVCAGSCFLTKELEKEQKSESPLSSKIKHQLEVVYLPQVDAVNTKNTSVELTLCKSPYLGLYESLFEFDIFHPPC